MMKRTKSQREKKIKVFKLLWTDLEDGYPQEAREGATFTYTERLNDDKIGSAWLLGGINQGVISKVTKFDPVSRIVFRKVFANSQTGE